MLGMGASTLLATFQLKTVLGPSRLRQRAGSSWTPALGWNPVSKKVFSRNDGAK